MECRRFDAFARTMGQDGSRRAFFAALLGGVAAASGVAAAEGGHRNTKEHRQHRRRAKRQRRRERRRDQPSQDPEAGVCSGTNGCGGDHCGAGGLDCFCWIAQATEEAFCGGPGDEVLNCGQCNAGQTCVDLSACGGAGAVACALPCG